MPLIMFLTLQLLQLVQAQRCLSHSGAYLSWFAYFKFPPKIKEGFAYSDSLNQAEFFISFQRIDNSNTALYHTLNQINTLPGLQVLAWNDQNQVLNSSTSAHAKGLIAFSPVTQQGFYLIHSLPNFPKFSGEKVSINVEPAQSVYGQSMLCMSLSLQQINTIAGAMMYSGINTYHNSVKNSAATGNIFRMAANNASTTRLIFVQNFKIDEWTFWIISKSNRNNGSLWQDGLVHVLGSNMIAQTWGRPLQPSYCPKTGFIVENVNTLSIGGIKWTEVDDHSKWGITVDSGTKVVCVGDMNRMPSQWHRGGTFGCVRSGGLWELLRKASMLIDSCKKQQIMK